MKPHCPGVDRCRLLSSDMSSDASVQHTSSRLQARGVLRQTVRRPTRHHEQVGRAGAKQEVSHPWSQSALSHKCERLPPTVCQSEPRERRHVWTACLAGDLEGLAASRGSLASKMEPMSRSTLVVRVCETERQLRASRLQHYALELRGSLRDCGGLPPGLWGRMLRGSFETVR